MKSKQEKKLKAGKEVKSFELLPGASIERVNEKYFYLDPKFIGDIKFKEKK